MRPGDAALVDDLLNPLAARRACLAALLEDIPGTRRIRVTDTLIPGGKPHTEEHWMLTLDDLIGLLDALAKAREGGDA